MPRALWLADIIADAGLVVRPFPGWETRGKTDFAPLGVIVHHTVTKPSTPDTVVDGVLALTGSSSAPAPLANYSTNRDGSVSIIAAGTANHGGAGTWNGVSGNKHWLGDEMKNLGSGNPASGWYEPWSAIQVESAMRAAAACLKHIAADETWLVGHKEYATPAGRKVDPHTLSMPTLRESVRAIMEDDDVTKQEMIEALNEVLAIGPTTDVSGAEYQRSRLVADSVHRQTITTGDYARSFLQSQFRTEQGVQRIEAGQDDLDEVALAALLLASLTPQVIADAISESVAQDVADLLAQRLQS